MTNRAIRLLPASFRGRESGVSLLAGPWDFVRRDPIRDTLYQSGVVTSSEVRIFRDVPDSLIQEAGYFDRQEALNELQEAHGRTYGEGHEVTVVRWEATGEPMDFSSPSPLEIGDGGADALRFDATSPGGDQTATSEPEAPAANPDDEDPERAPIDGPSGL